MKRDRSHPKSSGHVTEREVIKALEEKEREGTVEKIIDDDGNVLWRRVDKQS